MLPASAARAPRAHAQSRPFSTASRLLPAARHAKRRRVGAESTSLQILVNYCIPDRASLQIGAGAVARSLASFVNFFAVVAWDRPRTFGEAYVLQLKSTRVEILTHTLAGVTPGALAPSRRLERWRVGVSA